MPPPPASRKRAGPAAQEFLLVETIRDGITVLRKGLGLRAILMASSLNFALKAEEEQDALIFQYENFLNSLDFPLQIVIQSRRLNIGPYLETLVQRQKEETSELLKVQVGEYMEFVKTFVELSEVVSKAFYVVVPFQPSVVERRSTIAKALPFFEKPHRAELPADDGEFAQFKNQLLQRVDTVILGLRRLGLRVTQLDTDETIELFYGLYNPSESQKVSEAKPE